MEYSPFEKQEKRPIKDLVSDYEKALSGDGDEPQEEVEAQDESGNNKLLVGALLVGGGILTAYLVARYLAKSADGYKAEPAPVSHKKDHAAGAPQRGSPGVFSQAAKTAFIGFIGELVGAVEERFSHHLRKLREQSNNSSQSPSPAR